MALEGILRNRLDVASAELAEIMQSVKQLGPLTDKQKAAVDKLTTAAGALTAISVALPKGMEALDAAGKTLVETANVIKTADPRPAYNSVANALKELKQGNTALAAAVETADRQILASVSGIDSKVQAAAKGNAEQIGEFRQSVGGAMETIRGQVDAASKRAEEQLQVVRQNVGKEISSLAEAIELVRVGQESLKKLVWMAVALGVLSLAAGVFLMVRGWS